MGFITLESKRFRCQERYYERFKEIHRLTKFIVYRLSDPSYPWRTYDNRTSMRFISTNINFNVL